MLCTLEAYPLEGGGELYSVLAALGEMKRDIGTHFMELRVGQTELQKANDTLVDQVNWLGTQVVGEKANREAAFPNLQTQMMCIQTKQREVKAQSEARAREERMGERIKP